MCVLQVGSSLAFEHGGTAIACAQLTNHLARRGVVASVVTLGGPNGAGRQWALDPGVAAKVCHPAGPSRLGYCRDAAAVLESLDLPEIVHLHGLWRLHFLQAARFARRHQAPLVVSVHGMLHEQALRQRAAFKRLARQLFQDRLLRSAACLHATAAEEASEIRRLGFSNPIAVIPWGVDLPAAPPVAPTLRTADPRTVLFLGRLHPSKGLTTLLHAWARLSPQFPSWRLVVAGYDDDRSFTQELAALAERLGVAGSVSFPGPVEGAARERLFAEASLLVLPSPAENFGFVVPEALVRGIPVIATRGAPWSSLTTHDCGWWIAVGVEPLAAALAEALGRPPDVLQAMGERGLRFARSTFAWPEVAGRMTELYEWMLGRRPQPAFVMTS